jgi:hypothetical protein
MKVSLARTLAGWAPADEEAARFSKKFGPGEIAEADIKLVRNLKQHKWYWQMCTLVAMNHADLHTKEKVHETLKFLTGHTEVIKIDGRSIEIPLETKFSAMEQTEFDEYLSRCKDAVLQHLLPGVECSVMENEIAQMVSK